MKTNSKRYRIVRVVVGGALVVSLIIPIGTVSAASASAKSKSNFCTNLSNFDSKTEQQFSEKEAKLANSRVGRSKKLANKWSEKDLKLTESRNTTDEKRAEQFAKIGLKAKTTEQVTAVAAYKSALQTAITTRRSAVDAAIKVYRDGVDALVGTRTSTIDTAKNTLKLSADQILAKAKSDCDAGVDPATVRTTVKTQLAALRTQFNGSVKGIDSLKTEIDKLAATRKVSIDKAVSDFKKAVNDAHVVLKTALGQK